MADQVNAHVEAGGVADGANVVEKCTIREGRFVEPCETLSKATEVGGPSLTKARGIYAWALTNLTTHKPSRTFFGVKTREHPKGIAFNVCPWCGERIDAPFTEAHDAATPRATHPQQEKPNAAS